MILTRAAEERRGNQGLPIGARKSALLPAGSCSTQLPWNSAPAKTAAFPPRSFRSDPQRVPVKIRYARPVACQGGEPAHMPADPHRAIRDSTAWPLRKPLHSNIPSLTPSQFSSGYRSLRGRRRRSLGHAGGRDRSPNVRTLACEARPHPAIPHCCRVPALVPVEPEQAKKALSRRLCEPLMVDLLMVAIP